MSEWSSMDGYVQPEPVYVDGQGVPYYRLNTPFLGGKKYQIVIMYVYGKKQALAKLI